MLIFSGVWAIAKGMNSCQCFGRVSRPAASSFLYRGVAGRGVIKPKIGSPGGQLRISFSVRSATPGMSLSMPKIKDVMAKTLRWASRSSTTPYSPGLLKPFFTSARLAGSMDSIPMKIHLPPAAAIRSTSSSSRSRLALIWATQCTCASAAMMSRTKSLLRDIIAADAQVHWVAQISANLLRDEELVDLIAAAGGKWIFIGMESIDPANLADVKKGFNKPGEYAVVLDRLAQRNVFAITSFIFGMDNDTPGVAERTLKEIRTWPPGLPIFGLMTPLPATPLYKKLEAAGRLTRPKHWQEFIPFAMAHTPLKMSIDEAHAEVRKGWISSYNPEAIEKAVDSLNHKPLGYRINIFIARLCFRGIYFPQMGRFAWLKTILENRRTIFKLIRQGFGGGLHAAVPSVATQPVTEQQD